MKKEIHPEYSDTPVSCGGCNRNFVVRSTRKDMNISVCNECHPFYTGTQKLLDSEGRIDKFKEKYKNFYNKDTKLGA